MVCKGFYEVDCDDMGEKQEFTELPSHVVPDDRKSSNISQAPVKVELAQLLIKKI
jgi:hypothetical protein